ncbi:MULTISPECIES: hypothetical protein [unclassified Shinella]|uniref:hypothetical protein n=1 Tax=unclassified Shinella TaxID=2643062 RepID=UPI00234F0292|nr:MULTISPECIES: hypothetical protein [unclassified Shinella]MCO5153353.1 hypothetical protein [Shinella sp.]MDC7260532.1 hypothetical protein [Shinella sp. HY16]MDC7267427.1 hypothetical protein [Shinella sp. YZ44]
MSTTERSAASSGGYVRTGSPKYGALMQKADAAIVAATLLAQEFIKLPLRISESCAASVVDRDGRPVLTVDPNGDLSDADAHAQAALLLTALESLFAIAACGSTEEAGHA